MRNVVGHPSGAQRMHGVHSEVAHAAVLAVQLDHALPVDLLVGVKVAAVEQTAPHLDDLPEGVLLDGAEDAASAGEEGKFRRAGDDHVGVVVDCAENLLVCGKVDAKGLFAQQVLSGADDVGVELAVEVVRHGAVNRVYVGASEQVVVVRRFEITLSKLSRTSRTAWGWCRRWR
jgi:hypothetical protein